MALVSGLFLISLFFFSFYSNNVNAATRPKPVVDIEEGTTVTEEERRKVSFR